MNAKFIVFALIALGHLAGCSEKEQGTAKEQLQVDENVVTSAPMISEQPQTGKPAAEFSAQEKPQMTTDISPERLDREIKDIVEKITAQKVTAVPPEQLEQDIRGVIEAIESQGAAQGGN